MKINDFVQEFKDKKVINTHINPNAVSEFIRNRLEVKEYLPFATKKILAKMVVDANTPLIDGVYKNDTVGQYIGFVVAMLQAHTNLEFGSNSMEEYDILAQNKLLNPIIETFQDDYNECEILLKMTLTSKLEDNNVNVLVGKFLDGILNKVGALLQSIDLDKLIGKDFKQEDLAQLKSFLDKYNK